MGERRGRTCPSCGSAWYQRSARFCGRCGAVLGRATAVQASTSGRFGTLRSLRGVGQPSLWRWGAVGIVAVAVAGGAYLVGTSAGMLEDRPSEAGDTHVDLPDASDVGSATPASHEGCVPEGCELWRIERSEAGQLWPGERVILDTDWVDDPDVGEPEVGEEREVAARIRAYHTSDGVLLWERTLPVLGESIYGSEGAVGGAGLVLVSSPSGLVALEEDDGEPRWVSDGSLGNLLSWITIDGDLVVATQTRPETPPSDEASDPPLAESGPEVDVTRLDGQTGQTLWQLERRTFLGFGPSEAFVAGDEPGSVVVLDLEDGTTRWERHWSQLGTAFWWPQAADGRVVLSNDRAVVVADVETGESLLELDREPDDFGPVHLIGDLLTVGPPWQLGAPEGESEALPFSLVNLADPGSPPVAMEDVVSVASIPVRALPARDPLFGLDVDSLAVLLRDDDGYTLRMLDSQGGTRWQQRWETDREDCCWTIQQGVDGESVAVVPDNSLDPIRILGVDDGAIRETFALPPGLNRAQVLASVGPVVIAQGVDSQQRLVVAGPGGRFSSRIDDGYGLFALHEGVLVVSIGDELVGLDVEMLSNGS